MAWTLTAGDPTGQRWLGLLDRYPHLVFHEPVWASVIREGLRAEPHCLLLKRGGECRGGLLGFVYTVGGVRLGYMSLPYGGAIGEVPPPGELAHLLREWARGLGLSRVRLAASPTILDPLAGCRTPVGSAEEHFGVLSLVTHLLAFRGRDHETIWGGLKKRVRRDVRKAERDGVAVLAVHDAAAVDQFYELYAASMARNRTVAKYSRSFVQAVVDHLVAHDRGALLLAMHEEEMIAGMLLVDSRQMTHYLMAGSLSNGLRHCPNDLLLKHAIARAVERGHGAFDFLPSGENDPGLVRFKAKWGAEPIEAPVYELVTRPMTMRLFGGMYAVAESRAGRWLIRQLRRRPRGKPS